MASADKRTGSHGGLRLETLVGVSLGIHAEHRLDAVLQRVADAAREVTGARYAALGVLNASRTELSSFITSGLDLETKARIGDLPRGHGILGLLITDPHPLRLPDIAKHPKTFGFPPNHPPMKSFLGVPIRGRDGVFGNLYLTDKMAAAEFADDDQAVVLMLAAQAAVAIDNARLHEESARLLTEVRAMQASRDRFFAMINHELRNALTAVYGWADLLVRRAGPSPPKAAVEVYESAERTLGLLNDLLDLSRLEAARLKPVISRCDAHTLVQEAAVTLEPTARTRGVRIDISSVTRETSMDTDPQRVRQILVNLLSNAVRHSPDQETVEVRVRPSDGRVRFDVVDRGPGIAPEDQASIFEAFTQAGKQERGTGLGLTLSRVLSRFLGGDLTVESKVGSGACFTLDIPREAARQ